MEPDSITLLAIEEPNISGEQDETVYVHEGKYSITLLKITKKYINIYFYQPILADIYRDRGHFHISSSIIFKTFNLKLEIETLDPVVSILE